MNGTKRADEIEAGNTILVSEHGHRADVFDAYEVGGLIRIDFPDGSYITHEPSDLLFLA